MTRARRSAGISAGILLALVTTLVGAARAHEERQRDVFPTLDPVPARLAGVKVQLQRTLADQLVVENRTGSTLEVLDEYGIPFLRIGPRGAEANVGSATWYRSSTPGELATPPPGRDGRTPRWVRVAVEPAWGWYDTRLRSAPAAGRWTIPLRLGGVPETLHGRFRSAAEPAGTFQPRVTSGAEPFPGVRVSLVPGRVPALYLENTSPQPVVVLGAASEPFLRIGPDGTSANLRSPTWQRSGKAEVTFAPTPVDVRAAPVWRLQSPSPRYAWIEFRAAHPEGAPRPRAGARHWTVPLRLGAKRAVVSGVLEWYPATGGTPRTASPARAASPG